MDELATDFPAWHLRIDIMERRAEELQLLTDLEERHDELLRQLEELDKQVESVLALWTAQRDARREAA